MAVVDEMPSASTATARPVNAGALLNKRNANRASRSSRVMVIAPEGVGQPRGDSRQHMTFAPGMSFIMARGRSCPGGGPWGVAARPSRCDGPVRCPYRGDDVAPGARPEDPRARSSGRLLQPLADA